MVGKFVYRLKNFQEPAMYDGRRFRRVAFNRPVSYSDGKQFHQGIIEKIGIGVRFKEVGLLSHIAIGLA